MRNRYSTFAPDWPVNLLIVTLIRVYESEPASCKKMSYYSRHVRKLNEEIYPRADLTERIIRAKQFIDGHYAKKIDLDEICKKAYGDYQ